MKARLLTALAVSSLIAGSAFAADAAKPEATQPGMATPSASTAAPAAASDVMKLSTATGIVKSFDAMSRTLTLADNQSFVLEHGMTGKDLKADQHVSLVFKQDGDKKIVTQYKIVKQETAPSQG